MKLKTAALVLLAISLNGYANSQVENIFKQKFQGIAGGTNTGGGMGNTSELINWCRGITGKLQYFLDQSDTTLLINGSEAAYFGLLNGMRQASQVPVGTMPGNTLMYVALQRGIAIAEALKDKTMVEYVSPDASVWVLQQYYDFLIKRVSRADVDYYIPYYNCSNNCSYTQDQNRQFEERYVEYSHEALTWLNTEFVNNTTDKGPVPRSSSKLFLKLAEYMISNAVQDLTSPDSIWQNKYACVIENLRLLNQSVIEHNMGNNFHFGNDRIAVIKISSRIRAISHEFYRINGKATGEPLAGGFCR
jgi:hypothetical protein